MAELPQEFLDKLPTFIPPEKLEQVLASFEIKPKPAIRVNTLKNTSDVLMPQLIALGFEFTPVTWLSEAFVLENKSVRDLTDTQQHKDGLFYIQNLSSMVPALVLDPQDGEEILDIAAAPGSKTTHIAALMDGTGSIVANDISRVRSFTLSRILEQQGVTNTQVLVSPGQTIWERFPEYFDRTLVDAPCSMESRFDIHDAKTYREWTRRRVKELAIRQQYLLRGAFSATKPGGIIVYSTCTLSPEENEGVIKWLLKKEEGNIELEKVLIPGLDLDPGIDLAQAARIYPSSQMEGFFIAKIRKVKSNLTLDQS